MIHFLKKIKHKLLTENKFSRYLLYAIGEIILVVIGILLALNINNRNQQKINEDKITSILKEIQQDLVSDVEQAKEIFDGIIEADSIQDLILNDKYTYDDYKSNKARRLPYWYVDFVINSNGYDNLMQNIDHVPKKYQSILKDLKAFYISGKSSTEAQNARVRTTVYNNTDLLWSFDWNRERIKGTYTDEAIDYFLNDSGYKNMVARYMNDRENMFSLSQWYKYNAIEMYHKISDLTKIVDSIPKVLVLESEDTNFLNTLVGNYKIKDSLGTDWSKNVQITKEGNIIRFLDEYNDEELLYHKKSIFGFKGGSFYVQFNKTNEGELFLSANVGGYAIYMKEK